MRRNRPMINSRFRTSIARMPSISMHAIRFAAGGWGATSRKREWARRRGPCTARIRRRHGRLSGRQLVGAEAAFRTAYESANDDALAARRTFSMPGIAARRKFDDAETELKMVQARVKYGASHAAARYELAYTEELAATQAVAGNCEPDAEFRDAVSLPLNASYYSIEQAPIQDRARHGCPSRFRARMYANGNL